MTAVIKERYVAAHYGLFSTPLASDATCRSKVTVDLKSKKKRKKNEEKKLLF